MKKMAAGEFKAKCLTVMDTVKNTREPVLITKRGKPVAKLIPAEEQTATILGRLKGQFTIKGDVEAPVYPRKLWKAFR